MNGDLLKLRVPDLPSYRPRVEDPLHAQTRAFDLARHPLRVVPRVVGDCHHPHLDRGQPERQVPLGLLQQIGDEPLVAPQYRPVDDDDVPLLPAFLVGQPEPLGNDDVGLRCGDRLLLPHGVLDLDVYLWAVEGGLALLLLVPLAELLHRRPYLLAREHPVWVADELLRVPFKVGKREPEPVPRHAHNLVDVSEHREEP